MKLKEMVELVQQHHPELGVTEIVKMLNTAQEAVSFTHLTLPTICSV